VRKKESQLSVVVERAREINKKINFPKESSECWNEIFGVGAKLRLLGAKKITRIVIGARNLGKGSCTMCF